VNRYLNPTSLRKATRLLGFLVLNLGLTSTLKTGVVCPALYCYSCPLASFACPFGTLQHFIGFAELPLYAGGTIGLYSISLGRTYCGWFCPFGTVQDIVGGLRKKKLRLKAFPWAKFIVLAIALAAAYATGETVFCRYCPAGSLFAALPNIFILNLSPIPVGVWIHLITLAALLIGVLIIGRVWCRYFCPLGAIFGAFNRISGLTMNVNSTLCTGCKNCLKSCPMGINDMRAIGSSTDCIRCGKCAEACPTKAIRFALSA